MPAKEPPRRFRQLDKAFSYRMAEFRPMVAGGNLAYDGTIQYKAHQENIMHRFFPMTWTSLELLLAAAAAWVVYESEALSGASVLFLP
jgi:hypothetical protein